jgi:3-hydroxyisobutyrate dehydrogenase
MTKTAFIGLGNMGVPMAANLLKAGHKVLGFDLSPTAREAAAARGVTVADTLGDALDAAEVVITMLPSGAVVEQVVLGAGGVLAHIPAGALVVDCSTIDVATTKHLHREVAARGHTFVDAPVSGSVPKAQSGTLTFMVGGSDEAYATAQPVISLMGAKLVHAGGAAAGQAAKLCNNMLASCAMIATSEAFMLGEELGLDKGKLFEIVSSSSGDTWMLHNFAPLPGLVPGSAADEGYAPRFAAALMSKDLRLALGAAADAGLNLPVAQIANEVYADYAAEEGHLDTSGVIRQLRRRHS